jgi:Domain of unknown function (DUF5658)
MAGIVDLRVPVRTVSERVEVPRAWGAAALGLGCALLFVGLHTWLQMRGWSHYVAQLRGRGVLTGRIRTVPKFGLLKQVVADTGGVYLALVVAGIAIARRGPVFAIALPVVIWSAGPFVAGWISGVPAAGAHVVPLPIGTQWFSMNPTGGVLVAWLGTLVDALLALVPAFAVARVLERDPKTRVRGLRPHSSGIAAIGFGVFGLLLVVELPRLYGVPSSGFLVELVPYAALFVFGAALEEQWRWRWPVVFAVPILATNDFMQWAVYRIPYPAASLMRVVSPFVAASVFGASIRPFARVLTRLEARPTQALIACNALNVADAVLTLIGVRGGIAAESNPVVNAIGIPLKIVLVALLSAALARTRPRALVWPCAVLAGVVVWHLAGYLAQTPFAWWT